MKRYFPAVLVLAFLLVTGGNLLAQVAPADQIRNWPTPATWSPSRASGGIHAMTDVSPAIPFVAVAPCRIADTRGNGFSGQAGPPVLTAFVNRDFQITGSPAGVPAPPAGCAPGTIPTAASAVSIQATVVFPTSAGNLASWPAGAAMPTVSVLNWDAGTVALGNGFIVPVGATGAVTLRLNTGAGGQTTHVILDVNGYFAVSPNTGTQFAFITDHSSAAGVFANVSPALLANAISAITQSTGSGSGVFGLHDTGTGDGYGVRGETDSSTADAAGVLGVGSGGRIHPSADLQVAGIRGEDGGVGAGVIGATEAEFFAGGSAAGVGGLLMTPGAATTDAAGYLGRRTCVFIPMVGLACTPRAGHFIGNVHVQGELTATTKSFVEPMASDPWRMIKYVSLEGPEAGTYFRGRARFARGMARIEVPDHFREVTDPESLSIQVQPIGEMATSAVVKIDLDEIVVKGSRNVEFYYTVNGVRRAFKNHEVNPVSVFIPESAESRMPENLPEELRQRLVRNGLFNPDGTVNMETAERFGLKRVWEEAEALRAEAAARAAVEESRARRD